MPERVFVSAVAAFSALCVAASCAPVEPRHPASRPLSHRGRPPAGSSSPATPAPPPAKVEIWKPVPAGQADVPGLLPAGLCGFDPYLEEPCGDRPAPHYALVLGVSNSTGEIEATLRKARVLELAAGYPFVVSFGELPRRDARPGFAVVAGLFATPSDAADYRRNLPSSTEVVELAAVDESSPFGRFDDPRGSAIEIAEDTPAWSAVDLERLEHELDEALAKRWVKLPKQRARREAALAKLTPRCRIDGGRVFSARASELFRFHRKYAPVRCPDGTDAWVAWRATRLEAVVERAARGPKIHQVILVECDQPTLETRIFSAPSSATPIRLALAGPC
jgi:hypothetical protein